MSDLQTSLIPSVDSGTDPTVKSADGPAGQPRPDVPRRKVHAPGFLRDASASVWAGLGVTAFGFLLIFYSWIKVAATLDVGRQMPYVVSGAMLGLGFIVAGIAVVDMAVRRQDREERRHQLATMQHVLDELRGVLRDEDPQHP